ncbi:MAG: metal ABC transporter permease [Planctomycetes bacterium]|nr:metal ABC transporter permease [Planctomycetota bacterium]
MGYSTFIVLIGTGLLGASSGMVGSFAVLRRRALMGDALAHAALPGVCLAFLLMGHRDLPGMLLGAFLTGILGIAIINGLRFGTRIKEDAAIGIVLSVFYGTGIALSRVIQNQTSGGSRAGLDSYILGKTSGMIAADVQLIAAASLFCLLLVLLLYKEFKIVAFDAGFASVQGWPSSWIDLTLMLMIAVTVVIGLPAVGVVLVAALLIIPAATARFWTDRLGVMLVLSAGIGAVCGALGTLASSRFGWAAGPSIVLTGTVLFTVSILAAPRRGVLYRLFANVRLRRRILADKLLRRLFELSEAQGLQHRAFPLEDVSPVAVESRFLHPVRSAIRRLQKQALLSQDSTGSLALTERGWDRAVEATRTARLQDLYLTHYAGAACDVSVIDQSSLKDKLPGDLFVRLEQDLESSGRDPRRVPRQRGSEEDSS